MGVCTSCCKEEENIRSNDSIERDHLIDANCDNIVDHRCQSENIYAKYANGPRKKLEEQSDVNRIWQEMATNVIDVGTLGSHGLEQHEYRERMSHYISKLRLLSASKSQWSIPRTCILVDIPTSDKTLLSNISISNNELNNMLSTLKEIDKAFKELKIECKHDLIVPFRVPE